MEYKHTQRAPLWYLLLAIGVGMLSAAANSSPHDAAQSIVLAAAGALMLLLALSFRHLTITDEGDRLQIQYGPLPCFGRSIRYSSITSAEPGRSRVVDGWGIHWSPGRGWTYNLWGLDCVVVSLGEHVIRIGTDDQAELLALLRSKLSEG